MKIHDTTNCKFGWPSLTLRVILWIKLALFLTSSALYAGDYESTNPQFKLLLDHTEKLLGNDSASEYSLKLTRSRMVKMRGNLVAEEKAQLEKVKNLTDQIQAMDSPVLDDEMISDQLKDLQENLKSDLAKASFPLAFSRSARVRAEQYIDKIDSLLLERFKSRLISKSPSPVYFPTWGSTILELSTIGQEIKSQVNNSSTKFGDVKTSLGMLQQILFLIFGIALFWLKSFIKSEIGGRLELAKEKRSRAIFLVLENLNQLILPVIGYILIFTGLKSTAIFGVYSDLFFDYALRIILSVIVARWLILSLASRSIQVGHLFYFTDENEKKTVRLVTQLAMAFSTILIVDMIHKGFHLTEISQVNLYFPIVLINSIILFNASRVVKEAENYKFFAERSPTFSKLIANSILAATVLIPTFAVFGYMEAALYFLKGMIQSLVVIGGAFVFFKVLDTMVRGVLSTKQRTDGSEDLEASGKLLSSFIAFIVLIIALAVIPLVWGVGANNMQDIWLQINEGVSFGDNRITPTSLLKFLIIFYLGYMITRFLQRTLRERILPSTNLDAGGKGALLAGLGYIGYFLAAILALSSTGLDLSSLAILAGALSVGLGFGMQTIVSNFVSGIIMLIERPIKEGDWIEVSGYSGTVKTISVRSTHLQTFNKATAIIPNSAIISSSVLNWMHGDVEGRVSVPIEVAYGSDPDLVKQLLLTIAHEHPRVLDDPEPAVLLRGFGESALKFELRAFITEKFSLNVQSELNFEVLKVFEKHNIEIPYPKRDLNLKIDPKDPMQSIIIEKKNNE